MLCNIVKFINDAIGCDPLTVTQQVSTQGFDKNALCDALNGFYTANCIVEPPPQCSNVGEPCGTGCCVGLACDPIENTCKVLE